MDTELGTENQEEEISFADLGLDEVTLKAIERKGFVVPSPIQVLAIPRLLNGEANVIARARTGTGKTAAFGLPLVQTLREESKTVKAVVLEPTRELAMQTSTELASFTSGTCPRTCVVYGGASIGEQIRQLKKGAEIVVGTPGRVQDLIDRGVLDISSIEYFILDEGDEMLDMGFVDDIEKIFSSANPESRILLFSATVPREILKIAQQFMGDYEIVEEAAVDTEEPLLIEQKYWVVRENEKIEALVRLIDISPDFYGIVFVQKKTDADYVAKSLDERGYEVAALHGDIPQGQREKILARFRSGKTRIVVATDVAARGIDIEGLTHVVNYQLPFDGPTYVHRIGRTGRAGSSGMAVTFVRPDERRKLQYLKSAIKRSAKGEMQEAVIPSVEDVLMEKQKRLFASVKQKMQPVDLENTDDSGENASGENAKEVSVNPIFSQLAEELCAGKNAQDVVANLLSATFEKELNKSRYGKINVYALGERQNDARDRGSRRDRRAPTVRPDQIRLYVQLGRIDGYNPKKIASFFCGLLHLKSQQVDAIDMADKFCLVSLPKEAGKRALELSARDKSLPHMHEDSKVHVEYESRGNSSFSGKSKGSSSGGRRGRNSSSSHGGERKGYSYSEKKSARTATKRNSKAAIFKKSSQAVEY